MKMELKRKMELCLQESIVVGIVLFVEHSPSLVVVEGHVHVGWRREKEMWVEGG